MSDALHKKKAMGMYYVLAACLMVACTVSTYLSDSQPNALIMVLLISTLLIVLIVCIRQPFLFALSFLMFSYFRLTALIPALAPLQPVFLIAIAALSDLSIRYMLGLAPLLWDRVLSAFYGFSLWLLMSSFISSYSEICLEFIASVYSKIMLGFYLIAVSFRTESRVHTLLICYGIMLPVLSGLIIYHYYFNSDLLIHHRSVIMPKTALGDPNDSAFLIIGLLGFSLATLYQKTKQMGLKCLAIIGIPAAILAIGYTGSRGAIVGCAGLGISFFLIARMKGQAQQFIRRYSLLGIIGVCVILYSGGIIERITTTQSAGGGMEASAQARLDQWYMARQLTLQNPLFGVGPDAFLAAANDITPFRHVIHSSFFTVLCETGFIGCILYYMMAFFALKTHYQRLRDDHRHEQNNLLTVFAMGLFTSTIGLLFTGLFLKQAWSWTFLMNCALTVNLKHTQKTEASDD